jgi:fructose-1,6-bisphosphatase/inositol monophosphatase family enzyme
MDPLLACKCAVRAALPDDHRVWVVDLIDGTYGFVNNDNYTVTLALLVWEKSPRRVNAAGRLVSNGWRNRIWVLNLFAKVYETTNRVILLFLKRLAGR